MAHLQSFEKYRGDDWSFTLTVTENGSAFDLTGCDAVATISGLPGWSGPATITDATAGIVTVAVPHATTAQFAPGVYAADVQVTTPSGVVATAAKWKIEVIADVTI